MNPQFSIKNGFKSGGVCAILALLFSLLTLIVPSIECLMCIPTLALYIGAGALASNWDRREHISQTSSGTTISGAIAGTLALLGELLVPVVFNLFSPPTNTQATTDAFKELNQMGITTTTAIVLVVVFLIIYFITRFVVAAVLGIVGSNLTKQPNIEEMKQKNNITGLIKALSYKKDPATPIAAIKALGETGNLQAAEALIITLRNVNHEMRQAAVRALAQMKSSDILDKLIAAIQDQGLAQEVRQELLLSLEKSPEAIDALIAASLTNSNIRKDAAKCLVSLGKSQNPAFPDEIAQLLCGNPSKQLIEYLTEFLKSPDENVKQDAVTNLINLVEEHRAKETQIEQERRAQEQRDQEFRKAAGQSVAMSAIGEERIQSIKGADLFKICTEMLRLRAAHVGEIDETLEQAAKYLMENKNFSRDLAKKIANDTLSAYKHSGGKVDKYLSYCQSYFSSWSSTPTQQAPTLSNSQPQVPNWEPSRKITISGDQNAEWTDKPLRCPKCGTKLNDKTPRFGVVKCVECGSIFKVSNYNIEYL